MGDNPERLGSEASFAALCGVSPVERSSGIRQCRSPQPRRTAGKRRPAPDRADPPALRDAHPGVLRTPHQARQDPTRNRSVPQTLRRPRGVSPGHGHAVMTPVMEAV
ncbi:transposase [Streptomyces sp. NPDC056178]|uniref:transposase n=1 Tax=unclassified Streptomyces TaxID=2593676 RepID=UPI0035DB58E2